MFAVTLPLQARAKQRPRVFLANRSGLGLSGDERPAMSAVTPKATRTFERELRGFLEVEMRRLGLPVFCHPVVVGVRFAFVGDDAVAPTSRNIGDLDNLEKSILDAMNGVVFADDSLVVCKFSQKVFSSSSSLTVSVAAAQPDVVAVDCFRRVMTGLAEGLAGSGAKDSFTSVG